MHIRLIFFYIHMYTYNYGDEHGTTTTAVKTNSFVETFWSPSLFLEKNIQAASDYLVEYDPNVEDLYGGPPAGNDDNAQAQGLGGEEEEEDDEAEQQDENDEEEEEEDEEEEGENGDESGGEGKTTVQYISCVF